jgi:hypothetical protein
MTLRYYSFLFQTASSKIKMERVSIHKTQAVYKMLRM